MRRTHNINLTEKTFNQAYNDKYHQKLLRYAQEGRFKPIFAVATAGVSINGICLHFVESA